MTATISMTVANGLGATQSSLSNHQIVEFQKVIFSAFVISYDGLVYGGSILLNTDVTYIRVVWLCITATLHSNSLPHKTDHACLSSRSVTRITLRSHEYVSINLRYTLGSWCRVCDCLPMPATFAMGNHFWEMLQHGMFILPCIELQLLISQQAAFWQVSGAFDIISDIIIVLLSFYLVWTLRMPWKKKGIVTIAFGSRVL